MYLKVSQHALYRYMARVLNFDFSELRILFMIENGLPSFNHIKDSAFMSWCEHEVDGLGVFRDKLAQHAWRLMSQQQKSIAKNNKHFEERVVDFDNRLVFVIKDNTIITVLLQ